MKYAKYEAANKIVCEIDDLHSLRANYRSHIDCMPDKLLNEYLKKVVDDYFHEKKEELEAKFEEL
jgi:hypothetical protein